MAYDIYIRISKEGGRSEAQVSEQLAIYEMKCRERAAREGWSIGTVESETDVSGYSKKVVDRLLEGLILRVEAGGSEGVIVPNLERFARNTVEGILAEKRIVDAGGKLVSVEDGYTSGAPGSELMFTMRMGIAQDFAARAGEGLRARKRAFIERGGWPYPMPFGYREGEGKRPVKVAADAKIVAEIFRRRGRGEGTASQARAFDMPITRVRSIIANRFYLGEVRVEERKGIYTTLPNHHANIVTAQAFEAAQLKGEYAARDGSIAAGTRLAGLVYCTGCGKRCRGAKTGRGGKHISYVCTTSDCTARAGANAAALDHHVEILMMQAAAEHEPHVEAILLGDHRFEDALAEIEKAQHTLAEYRDDLEMQRTLGRDGYREGLQVRRDAVETARAAAAALRPASAKVRRITVDQPLALHEREVNARYIARIELQSAGGRGSRVPLEERVRVFFHGAEQPYLGPVGDPETMRILKEAHGG